MNIELHCEDNITTVLDVFIADTFVNRFLGYMFRERPHKQAIIFKPCSSIHTFFMKFNIDVLFLDKNMEVIKMVKNLKPGKIIMPVIGANAVLETEEGGFRKIQIGNKIHF